VQPTCGAPSFHNSPLKYDGATISHGARRSTKRRETESGPPATHVVQDERLILSGYDTKLDITHRQAEREAYSVEERVIENEMKKYNPDWSSKKAIDKYLDARPTLYPNLSQPILLKEAIPHD